MSQFIKQKQHFINPKLQHLDLTFKIVESRGAWVAQSVKRPTSAQVMISVCGFELRIGLCADSSEPGACFQFCVSLSLCPSPAHALSLSVAKINKNIIKKNFKQLRAIFHRLGQSTSKVHIRVHSRLLNYFLPFLFLCVNTQNKKYIWWFIAILLIF